MNFRKHKYIQTTLRSAAIFFLTLLFGFSNLVSFLPQSLQNNKLAENLKVKEALAALDYVGGAEAAGTNTALSVSLTALTGGIGSAALANDLVIVATGFVGTADGDPGVSTTGYTEIADLYANDSNDANFSVNWKIMGGTPDTSVSCNGSSASTNVSVCAVHVWRNVDTGTPLDVVSTTATAANTGVPNGPAITPVTTGAFVVTTGLGTSASAITEVTVPTGYSNLVSANPASDPGLTARIGLASKAWTSGAEDPAAWGGFDTSNVNSWGAVTLAIRPAPTPTTTLSTGTNPGDSTIAPGGAITSVNGFTLTTNTGTDAITSITVNLSTNSGVGTLTITDGADAVLGSIGGGIGTGIVTGSNAIGITSTNATTGGTAFKVKVTPLSHANMPVPDGAAYAITGAVTDWAGTNAKAGQASDTSSTVTIDNDSPAGTTGLTPTAGDGQVSLSWTNPADGDFQKNIIFCKTATMASGEAPAEGSDPAVDAAACDATARVKFNGVGTSATITGLTNGTLYFFRAYPRDTNGNFTVFASTQEVSATPVAAGPNATDYTNGAEAGLNFSACATTGCGGRSGQAITVTGSAFGTACSSPGTVVKIGTVEIPCADVSTWSATSITFTVTTSTTAFGGTGASGLIVRSAAVDDPSPLEFFVFPRITSISPSGAGEGKEGDAITITGNRFDAGSATGTVAFANCFTSNVSATLTSWSDTSIALTVPTGISDTDDSCDVNVVRASGTGSKSATSTAFNVLPDLTSFTSLTSSGSREYAAGDTDGLAQLNGKHFGTATGTVAFTGGFGSVSATIHGTAEGSCTSAGWWQSAGTNVCVRVPTAISDSVYTGTITLTRSADSKTSVSGTFRVLPRIIANDPTSTTTASIVKISGDHFCQSGTCPVSPNRSTTADNVKFGATQALDGDFVNSGGLPCSGNVQAWTDAEICVRVPSGASGASATQVTSNTSFTSNTKAFTVVSTVPGDPTGLAQYKQDGTTPITAGATTNQSSVKFEADLTASISITMILQVEATTTAATFNGVTLVESAPCTGLSCPNVQVASLTLSDGFYKWRARSKNTTTLETSNWVVFTDPAFTVDTTGPAISATASSNVTDISADITWNTNENATRQVGYGTTCPASSGQAGFDAFTSKGPTTPSAVSASPHSVSLSGLTGGTTYNFRVRAADSAGNPAVFDPAGTTCFTFTTSAAVTRIMKTTEHYICTATSTSPNWVGETGVACSADGAKKFGVFAAEHSLAKSIDQKSYFIELSGISTASASFSVGVKVNSEATTTYSIVSPGGSPLPWFILHKPAATSTLDYPGDTTLEDNTISVAITGATATALLTAKAIMTYFYRP